MSSKGEVVAAPKASRLVNQRAAKAQVLAPPTNNVGPLRAPPTAPAAAAEGEDAVGLSAFATVLDRMAHAATARATGGLSPAALLEAYLDWAVHLAGSPGKQIQLVDKAMRKATRLAEHASQSALRGGASEPCIAPLPQDRQFSGEAWQVWPYNLIYQSFLLNQQWWHNATTGVRGVTRQHENVVEFITRQILDTLSPSNFLATNPELTQETLRTGGLNLVRGWRNLVEDRQRAMSGKPPPGAEKFQVGRDVAATPGKVVYRNRLIELIQYAPATGKVRPEPILIVPAWIMKYYILDLSPRNSLVKWLTEQGFTVFIISWKNPGPEDRDLSMEDYRELGVMAALDAVEAVAGPRRVHAAGYCLGGTLLSVAAAAMARDNDDRLQSLTLLAAQTDFTEAGELTLFINDSQLAFLEDMMWEQGFLESGQMAGAFQLLRSNDLIWSHMIRDYMLGAREPISDMMAWNADATRMPYRMHSEYLRRLFLNNELAEGHFQAGGQSVALSDIRAPIFAVGATRDHVAPWRSVFKIDLFTETEVTFVLTGGGHNAGIVAAPGRDGASYQALTKGPADRYVDPDSWIAAAPRTEGSWWAEWARWLRERSGDPVKPPAIGAASKGYEPLGDAPGEYVFQK